MKNASDIYIEVVKIKDFYFFVMDLGCFVACGVFFLKV